jgi:cytochrome c553
MKHFFCSLSALLLIGSLAAHAAGDADPSAPCQACHGGNGVGVSADIPNLAGQHKPYLVEQLKAFRSGERKHDIMNPIAKQLSDADIETLATYWSSLTPGDHATATAATLARKSMMTFPANFPRGFTVYRTEEDAQTKTVTQNYANAVAVEAARKGKPLPQGSIVIVANSVAGKPASYSGMEIRDGWGKDVPELLRNGDWSYALFDGQQQRRDTANYAMCLGCHKSAAADSYVFTLKLLAEKAKS